MTDKIIDAFKEASGKEKANFFLVSLSLFFVLFSYPIIRSTTTAMFLQSHGAKNSPLVWLYSVLGLTLVVFLFNKFQRKLKVHRLFYRSVVASSLIFLCLSICF